MEFDHRLFILAQERLQVLDVRLSSFLPLPHDLGLPQSHLVWVVAELRPRKVLNASVN